MLSLCMIEMKNCKQEMEDNPGSVTSDAEERFSTLQKEVMSEQYILLYYVVCYDW